MSIVEKQKIFELYRKVLVEELQNAHIHFSLCKNMDNAMREHGKDMDNAGWFFGYTRDGHAKAAVYHLSKVIDIQDDAITICRYLNFIEQNIDVFDPEHYRTRIQGREHFNSPLAEYTPPALKDITGSKKQLDQFHVTISNLREWRNKHLAHRDKKIAVSGTNIYEVFQVKADDISKLIECVKNIINLFSQKYDNSSYTLANESDLIHDVEFILISVRQYLYRKFEKPFEEQRRGNNVGI